MNLQTAMILVGAVAIIGLVAIMLMRGLLGDPSATDTIVGSTKH